MSLSREEMARAKFTFSIYDFDGNNKMDAFQLGNALRALGLCPTLKRIDNLGGAMKRNEKMLTVDEFLAIYQDAKKDKQEGTIEDYLECLQSYDKENNGRIHLATLIHLLQGYGEERLDRSEAEEIIQDCHGEPDDDGGIDYKYFLKNLMKGPELKIPIAMLRATEEQADDSGIESSRRDEEVWQACPEKNRRLVEEEESGEKSPKRKSLKAEDSSGQATISASPEPESEAYKADISAKSRNQSVKSAISEGTNRSVSPDISISEGASTKKSSKRSSGKFTKGESVADSEEASVSEPNSANLSGARGQLKTDKSRQPSAKALEVKKKKKEEEPEVKPKFQQPLIALKTDGLFGKKK